MPCLWVVPFQILPKLLSHYFYPIVVILEKADFIPFRWIAVLFSVRASGAYPEIGEGWVSDLEIFKLKENSINLTSWKPAPAFSFLS